MSERLTRLKTILWVLVGVLASVTAVRFAHGLGSVTNLSDAAPWGLWIGFDVMSGVALAAGGFVLAGIVYIFGLERYRPFVRAAILTALLGYAAVAVGLLYDLGLPWRIWHPLIHWQYHSVLFEVAMCVMLYLTVLALEFLPVILEHRIFRGAAFQVVLKALKKVSLVLVIAGIVLSTLHQSSLGSLFLITPYRLHPLWYSHIIYVLFFVSAVALGLMTVVLESLFSHYFLGHELHAREISGLGLAASVVLWIYVTLRLGDLAIGGTLGMALDGSWQSVLFLSELAVSAAIPATLMIFRSVRSRIAGVGVAASMVVLGMIWHRLDVSIVAFARPEGIGYFPSWEEFAVSLGIVAGGILIFLFFAEHLNVFDDVKGHAPERRRGYDPEAAGSLLPGPLALPRRYSVAALAGAILALPFLPVGGVDPRPVPVQGPRSVEALIQKGSEGEPRVLSLTASYRGDPSLQADPSELSLQAGPPDPSSQADPPDSSDPSSQADPPDSSSRADTPDPSSQADRSSVSGVGEARAVLPPGDDGAHLARVLLLDADRDGDVVLFDHDDHAERLGGERSCETCHHLTKPLDENTSCSACHTDMFEPRSVFDHDVHVAALDGNEGCTECHRGEEQVKSYETITECSDCHRNEIAARAFLEAPEDHWKEAVGYVDAMHGLCVECHEREALKTGEGHPEDLNRCTTCHDVDWREDVRRLMPQRREAERVAGSMGSGTPPGQR